LAIIQLVMKLEPIVAPLVVKLVGHAQDAAAGVPVTQAQIDATMASEGTSMAAVNSAVAAMQKV
jgi:hypothetical protein